MKSVDNVKSALKLRTEPRENALTLRMGVKKHTLPFEVRTIASDEFIFVHVPPSAEIFRVTKDGLVLVEDADTANAAAKSLRRSRSGGAKKRGGKKAAVELPAELQAALNKVPAGYRLGFDKDGQARLIKTRNRTK